MTKKDKKKQVGLTLLAAALIYSGIAGVVASIGVSIEARSFGIYDAAGFCIMIGFILAGGKLLKSAHNVIPSKINDMTGVQFENYVAELLRKKGHSVQLTPKTGDYGVDLIMDGHVAIQCKRYGKGVGVKAIQEVYSGMQHYGCSSAIVATNSVFTANAKTLANELGVILWDASTICRDI